MFTCARDRCLEIAEWVSARRFLGTSRCFDRPGSIETEITGRNGWASGDYRVGCNVVGLILATEKALQAALEGLFRRYCSDHDPRAQRCGQQWPAACQQRAMRRAWTGSEPLSASVTDLGMRRRLFWAIWDIQQAYAALVGAEIRPNLVVHLANPLIFIHPPSMRPARRGLGRKPRRSEPSVAMAEATVATGTKCIAKIWV
jgi:hypothetical protein